MPLPSHASTSTSDQTLLSPTPSQLRVLVLDYLCHACYPSTVKRLLEDSAVQQQVDADGDEIIPSEPFLTPKGGYAFEDDGGVSPELLMQVELREKIKIYILSGLVEQAIGLINAHFPSVLDTSPASVAAAASLPSLSGSLLSPSVPLILPSSSSSSSPIQSLRGMSVAQYTLPTSIDPRHLLLNLRILDFIEACRTVPLPYNHPGTRERKTKIPKVGAAPLPDDTADDISGDEGEHSLFSVPAVPLALGSMDVDEDWKPRSLLARLQKLRVMASTLDKTTERDVFYEELKNVGGLLAYKTPEGSLMDKYLRQERREAVADQINRSILCQIRQPIISDLELLVRSNATVWGFAHYHKLKPLSGGVVPPSRTKHTISKPQLQPSQSAAAAATGASLVQSGAKAGEKDEIVPPFDFTYFLDGS